MSGHVDATALRQQGEMLSMGPYKLPEGLLSSRPALPPRVRDMIAILLAHADDICRYPFSTVVLQLTKEGIQAKITHNLG